MFDWQTALLTSAFWAPVVAFLIYFAKNPEKVEKWYSIAARSFSFISTRIEKSSVARDIQSDINSFTKELNSFTDNPIIPYKAKIKWTSNTTKESFIKENKVVIKMQHHRNQAKNFLYATLEWVNKGLVPETRHMMDDNILKAVEFAFINRFLSKRKRFDVRQLFFDEVYEPQVKKHSQVKRYTSVFNKLDKTGLFVGLALEEFSSLGREIGATIPTIQMKSETIAFTKMLERLAGRRRGEEINPGFEGKNIKCHVVLISKPETYLQYGLSPYLNWINKCVGKGISSIYVCGIGDINIKILNSVRDAYGESKKITIASEYVEPLNGNKSKIIHLVSRQES